MIDIKWHQFGKDCRLLMQHKDDSNINVVTNADRYYHIDKDGRPCFKSYTFSDDDDATTFSASKFKLIGVRDHNDQTVPVNDVTTTYNASYFELIDRRDLNDQTVPVSGVSDIMALVELLDGEWPDEGEFNCDGAFIHSVLYTKNAIGQLVIDKINNVTREEFELLTFKNKMDDFTNQFIDKYAFMGLTNEQIGMLYSQGFKLPD